MWSEIEQLGPDQAGWMAHIMVKMDVGDKPQESEIRRVLTTLGYSEPVEFGPWSLVRFRCSRYRCNRQLRMFVPRLLSMWTCLLCSKRVVAAWQRLATHAKRMGHSHDGMSDVKTLLKATVKRFVECYDIPPHAEHLLNSVCKAR